MKRFIALVLSLVMALSLCAPAWGATTVSNAADLRTALETGGDIAVSGTMDADGTFTVPFNSNRQTEYLIDAETVDSLTGGEYVLDDAANWGFTVVVDEGETLALSKMDITADSTWVMNMKNNGSLTLSNINLVATDGAGVYAYGSTGTTTLDELNVNHESLTNPEAPWAATAVAASNGQTMVINSGTYVGSTYGLYIYNSGATVTINGGTFEAPVVLKADGNYSDGNAAVIGKIVVNDGDFNGEIEASNGNAQIVINGGNFANFAFDNAGWNTRGSLAITGGTFDADPTDYVPDDGWYTITEGDGTWTVTKAPVVAKIGEVEYKTLAEAVAVGGTVELLTNVTLEKHVNISKDTVINLNGYNIAKTEGNTIFYVTDGAALTINGTGVETISLENADGAYAIWSAGNGIEANEITLNQVTVEATTCGVYHNGNDFGAKVTIEKSTVKGGGAGVFLSGSEAWADPQNNKMNDLVITDSTIEGASAVEVKHGNVVVDNSTLKATGEPDVRNYGNGSCTEGYALALTNNGMENAAEASTGTVQINSGNFTGNIGIKDDDTTAMVENTTTTKIQISGGTFSADPKAYVVDGYAATEVEGKYVVAVKKAETNKVETEVKVDVAEPSVEVPVIDTSDMTEKDKTLVENVANSLKEDGVKFDDTALVAAAAEAKTAVENKVTAAEAADLLAEENIPVASDDKVSIVVQPYYDVKVESITVDENGAASVALDITPMYQTVVTTAAANEEIVTKDTAEVGEEVNAVAVGDPKKMTVTKPVTIKIAIPSTLAVADGDGFKPLYVTHTKEETGVKYVYVATVEKDGSDYTATFVNPNGFSSFTLSTTNSTVAYVKDSNTSYATIESAISDAGKGAVIEVMVSDQVVNITAPCSFKLKWADNITEPTFNVAKGYTMSKWHVNGVYTYIVQSASAGGYAPVAPSTPEKVVTSADTFDAGIALYVGMSVMAAAGSAVVLKKRED